MRLLPKLALSLLVAAATPLSPLTASLQEGSLEAYLERIRAEREAEAERLRGRVLELVGRLGSTRSAPELKKLHAELDALGGEAAPLLLPYLDPLLGATA